MRGSARKSVPKMIRSWARSWSRRSSGAACAASKERSASARRSSRRLASMATDRACVSSNDRTSVPVPPMSMGTALGMPNAARWNRAVRRASKFGCVPSSADGSGGSRFCSARCASASDCRAGVTRPVNSSVSRPDAAGDSGSDRSRPSRDRALPKSRRTVLVTSQNSPMLTRSFGQPSARPNCSRTAASAGTEAGLVRSRCAIQRCSNSARCAWSVASAMYRASRGESSRTMSAVSTVW